MEGYNYCRAAEAATATPSGISDGRWRAGPGTGECARGEGPWDRKWDGGSPAHGNGVEEEGGERKAGDFRLLNKMRWKKKEVISHKGLMQQLEWGETVEAKVAVVPTTSTTTQMASHMKRRTMIGRWIWRK